MQHQVPVRLVRPGLPREVQVSERRLLRPRLGGVLLPRGLEGGAVSIIYVPSDKIPRSAGFMNCFLRFLVVYLPCCQGKVGEVSEICIPTLAIRGILSLSIVRETVCVHCSAIKEVRGSYSLQCSSWQKVIARKGLGNRKCNRAGSPLRRLSIILSFFICPIHLQSDSFQLFNYTFLSLSDIAIICNF